MANKNNGFNNEQNLALDNPININLIISAGAGSGKTKTLSEKVMRLIEDGLQPSELLVLTFTNNAAHEMKERIIAKFSDNKEIAYQLASAHIQTFDSFSQYLVSTYSSRLNISEQLSIVNEDVINTKIKEYVDEVFDSYYLDEEKYQRLYPTLFKFNLRDDSVSRRVLLDLVNRINGLSNIDKDDFLNHYEEKFLSRDFFNENIHLLVNKGKETIITAIYQARFLELYYDAINEMDNDKLKAIFSNPHNFEIDIYNLSFQEDTYTNPLYKELLTLLETDDVNFINKVQSFLIDHPFFKDGQVSKKTTGYEGDELKKYKDVYQVFKDLIILKDCSLSFIKMGDVEEEYQRILSFKDDILLFIDMVKEVNQKVNDYKKVTNSYLFSDISNMALSLMIEDKYIDVAEEIRSRFKFIMVDEYQDTNDLQEAFIESLLKENNKGEKSHLFCVGDAKQSIYAFRDSNVELFRNRQYLYENSEECNAIPMNKNYRSGKQLLLDINHIFNYYMTINHGSIAYHQDKESLKYDEKVNIYNKSYPHFGVHRITSVCSINNDNAPYSSALWEARAIAADISNKIKEGFPVSVRSKEGNIVRPCQYGDFCILVGNKNGVDLYQKTFQEFGIPLNCTIKRNLNEVDAITLIQSLIGMMNYIHLEKTSDPYFAHLFASVARSYIFEYDDQKIFDLLNDTSKEYFLLNNDPIVIQIIEFMNNHQSSSFSHIFIDMLIEFKIIEYLYKIGSVDDVISKIESLYSMALTQEKAGEGISEFVELMNNIRKYDADLNSKSLYQVEDAVDLMTIHASKGLERKIVYMPNFYSKLIKGSNRDKPDYTFSKKLGILFNDYTYRFDEHLSLEDVKNGNPIYSFYYNLHNLINPDNQIEIDEHVRLFYVALTRAENIVYLVGDIANLKESTIQKARKDDNLYGMMSYTPYYPVLDEKYILGKINKGINKREDYDLYLKYRSYMMGLSLDITNDDLSIDNYYRYIDLWKKYYQDKIYSLMTQLINKMEKDIFVSYHTKFSLIDDINEIAQIFSLYFYRDDSVKSVKDLLNYHQRKHNEEDEEEEVNVIITSDNVNEQLTKFRHAIITGEGVSALGIKETSSLMKAMFDKKNYGNVPIGIKDNLFTTFALYFDQARRVKYLSFKTDDYEDKITLFDFRKYPIKKIDNVVPSLKEIKVNNDKINFTTKIHLRASKTPVNDEDLPVQEVLDRGIYLHRLLELTDLKKKDTSFIKDKKDKELIDKVLSNDLFKDLDNARVYQEFNYYDEELLSSGYIDLLIIKNDEYYIIDYKAKHVYDPAYVNQLHTYKRNVMNIYHVKDEKKIHMYLLSIIDNKLIKID